MPYNPNFPLLWSRTRRDYTRQGFQGLSKDEQYEKQMKRKATVLAHNQNASKLTKTMRYSHIVNGGGGMSVFRKKYITNYDLAKYEKCLKTPYEPTKVPSSNSDVPGKIVDLFDDKRRPYDYNKTVYTMSNSNQDLTNYDSYIANKTNGCI